MPEADRPESPDPEMVGAIREARATLGPHGGFRTRVLLDMLLLELGRLRDGEGADTRADPAARPEERGDDRLA